MQRNRVELAGYLAAKPELRFLPSGTKVANARLGESYRYETKSGETETHTNWHSLTFYDRLAEVAITFSKGDNVSIEGIIEQRQFTPADGSKRTVHEIVVKQCHLIAAPRTHNNMSEETQLTDANLSTSLQGDANHDPNWPA